MLALKGKENGELAKHLEVSTFTISKWCTNTRQPSIVQLYQIAAYLNIPPRELLEPEQPGADESSSKI